MPKVLLLVTSIVLSLIAAALFGIALLLDEKLIAVGLEHELVAPNVEFEALRIGNTHTCVTLRRLNAAQGRWRSRDTCYKMFPLENDPATTIRDLETGEELQLKAVCQDDGEWIAAKLGIPERLRVEEIWRKQCRGWRSVSLWSDIFAAAVGFTMMMTLFNEVGAATTHERREGERSMSTRSYALPAKFGYASLLVWQYVLQNDPSLQLGWSLHLLRWTSGMWLLIAGIIWIVKRLPPQRSTTEIPSTTATRVAEQEEPQEESAVAADQLETVEKPSRALSEETTTCVRHHWQCRDCGKVSSSSQRIKRRAHCKRRHVFPRVRVLLRKNEEEDDALTTRNGDTINSEHDCAHDWDHEDAARSGLRQRSRPQEKPTGS